jgi:hypothetical protein
MFLADGGQDDWTGAEAGRRRAPILQTSPDLSSILRSRRAVTHTHTRAEFNTGMELFGSGEPAILGQEIECTGGLKCGADAQSR